MTTRRWLAVVLGILLIGGAVGLSWLPEIVRHFAVARVRATTGRPATIERVDVSLLRGRFAVHGLRVTEPDGVTPFAELARLDARLHLPSLLIGHLWIRELTLSDSNVSIVRRADDTFNLSDIVQRSGTGGKTLDVTVDRFHVVRGRASLEDQALAPARTWASEDITIDAYGLSTRAGGGRATGRTIIAGAPSAFEITNLRLHPIHMEATARVVGLDVTPARVYLPPNAHVRLDGGRVTSTLTVVVDAVEGVRADATAELVDVLMAEPAKNQPLARVPRLTAQVEGLAFREGALRLDRLVMDGAMDVRDPTAKAGAALRPSSVRASVAELTWPATTSGRVDVQASIPGGGSLAVVGTVRPPPAATQLNVRVEKLNLAPWAQFVPGGVGIAGIADADLRMDEPFAAGIPARVLGSAGVTGLVVADARQEVVRARRVEASGLEVQWPERVSVRRVTMTGARGTVERDANGEMVVPLTRAASEVPLTRATSEVRLTRAPSQVATSEGRGSISSEGRGSISSEGRGSISSEGRGSISSEGRGSISLLIHELLVRDGFVAWRDAGVTPAARLDISAIDASVTGVAWPLHGPLAVRASLRPPGGGQVRVSGRVGVDPITADLRINAVNAQLAPYQPYLPTTAKISGTADLDLAVVLASVAEQRVTARGTAALARVDVRDGQRTVMRAERATATGIDVAWPERIAIAQVALARPWLLLERDDQGELGLRELAPAKNGAVHAARNGDSRQPQTPPEPLVFTIARLTAEGGGMRIVDRAIAPAFAVDVDTARLRVDGLSHGPARPATLDLTARVGGTADLVLRGTLGPLGGPLKLDVDGELHEFAVPRANSYLQNQVGWTARAGRLTTKLRGRLDGDALSAKTDVRVSRLSIVRASRDDAAQSRIGLPLGMLTSLMKNSRGDINVSFPVGGRLGDPRFDFREAMWSAVRTVAINAITLPVSWIGRVQFSADSRIEKIQVDPLTFEPGTATLTPDGAARVPRLKAFLDQLPEVRMAMTPVISSRDTVDPRRPVNAAELAERRMTTVRTALREAGVDDARVVDAKPAERDDVTGQMALEVLDHEGPRPSKVRETLRRFGMPLKDADE